MTRASRALGRSTVAAVVALVVGLLPLLTASADPPPRTDGHPYVPRYQGPYNPHEWEPSTTAWGFALVGTGAFVGGFGLYALETGPAERCVRGQPCSSTPSEGRAEWGAAMLVSGIFVSGLGIYIVASTEGTRRTVLGEAEHHDAPAWSWSLAPFDGGALLSTVGRF